MEIINYQTNTPEENIAIDEYLLLKAEQGAIGESLRFWESGEYFTVVGRSGKVESECFKDKCRKDNIKILRRISGGGTVLQGPGCLNYSLILSYGRADNLREINASYGYVLGLISEAFRKKNIETIHLPVSDMVFKNKKFSGNAQARKKKFFLHHGTILYDFDLIKISEYIKYPPREPDYRGGRNHDDFVVNLPFVREELEEAIKNAVADKYALSVFSEKEKEEVSLLIEDKYSKDYWNYAF